MAYMEEITRYKTSLMETLWENEEIKNVIKRTSNLDSLSYSEFRKHVKRYGKNPDTVTEKGVYIFFEVDPIKAPNTTIMEYALYIWIIVSEDILETDSEVLTDKIAEILDRNLNGARDYGIGMLEVYDAITISVPPGFCGRKMTYLSKDFNRRRRK